MSQRGEKERTLLLQSQQSRSEGQPEREDDARKVPGGAQNVHD